MECREHLQARLMKPQETSSDSLSQRSSSRVSQRSKSGSIIANEEPPVQPYASTDRQNLPPGEVSSSSGLSIPELSMEVEDGGIAHSDSVDSLPVPIVSQSFAQHVRAELDSLATKSASADLPQWVAQANKKACASEPEAVRKVVAESQVHQRVDLLPEVSEVSRQKSPPISTHASKTNPVSEGERRSPPYLHMG